MWGRKKGGKLEKGCEKKEETKKKIDREKGN
jgi:hypothetical protein